MQLPEMKNYVDNILRSLGVRTPLVLVSHNDNTIAGATGIYLNLPLLSINAALGQILVNTNYVNSRLTTEEQRFVLTHEVVHIYQNHVAATVLFRVPRAILESSAKELSIAFDILKILLQIFGVPPPESTLTKQQEIQADVWAICLTGNRTCAISCLTKLVDGNLSKPSHVWEALDIKIPVMSMQERIIEIQKQTNEL